MRRADRAVVERWLSRAGRYLEMIRDVLIGRGLPEELLCSEMIESGFWRVAPTTKGYKRYIEPRESGHPSPIPPIKLYTMHLSQGQVDRLNAAIRGSFGQPG